MAAGPHFEKGAVEQIAQRYKNSIRSYFVQNPINYQKCKNLGCPLPVHPILKISNWHPDYSGRHLDYMTDPGVKHSNPKSISVEGEQIWQLTQKVMICQVWILEWILKCTLGSPALWDLWIVLLISEVEFPQPLLHNKPITWIIKWLTH